MTAGLMFVNDQNVIQVDETFVCLSLVAKGTATATVGHAQASSVRIIDIQFAGRDMPVIALRLPANRLMAASHIGTNLSGSTWTFRIAVVNMPGGSALPYTFDYYIFDRPPQAPASGFVGIVVNDANGSTTFNSQYPPALYKTLAEGTWNAAAKTYTFDTSRSYAVAITQGIGYVEQETESQDTNGNITFTQSWHPIMDCIYSTTGGFYLEYGKQCGAGGDGPAPTVSYGIEAGSNTSSDTPIMVFDVTGL